MPLSSTASQEWLCSSTTSIGVQSEREPSDVDVVCVGAERYATQCPRRADIGWNSNYLPFDLLALACWVNADAATDLTDAGVRGLLNNLAAVEATRAEVCSFVGFLEDMRFSLSVRGKRERRESGPTDSRPRWIRQTIASDPDSSASGDTQPPGVRTGTGCMRAQIRSSIGGRP